jgi:N-acetylmuramic acid 6-phosphate etherase
MKPHSFDIQVQEFLREASQFQLGELVTESSHPRTKTLSDLSLADLPAAIRLLQSVEIEAVKSLLPMVPDLEDLSKDIRETLGSGGRVFFCGCGATGRLSLSLETLWRESIATHEPASPLRDQVVSLIAGGDYALVRSIEKFEDFPEYGVRQLNDLGFSENDLLVSTTEGGETPFVIGATEEAARVSRRQPYFMFCNPPELLAKTAERSRRVLENSRIRCVSFATGPMALAGSTRLQASTVLMLAAGSALFANLPGAKAKVDVRKRIETFLGLLHSGDFTPLAPLIEAESATYEAGHHCQHVTSRYGITVLTDTTERSPTFSLLPFENEFDSETHHSWTYLTVPGAKDAPGSWKKILGRSPRALDWDGFKDFYGQNRLHGFDFSPSSFARRQSELGRERLKPLTVDRASEADGAFIVFEFEGRRVLFPSPDDLLCEHLLLKCLLNVSSTLVMGRMGRFQGNLMLYVRPTNKKLVDRSVRYVRLLLADAGFPEVSYESVCRELFEQIHCLPPDESVVLRTFEKTREKLSASLKE